MRENLKPLFHEKLILENGTSWSLGHESLKCIDSKVNENCVTLETGIGYSTLVFAASGSKHTVCFPVGTVEGKLRSYASAFGVSFDNTLFLVGMSQYTLPKLSMKIDFALIDGDHAFPAPILDFYYIDRLMVIGGFMLIDDMQIRSVRDVHSYASTSPHWKMVQTLDDSRALLMQKMSDASLDWFGVQPYNHNFFRPLHPIVNRLHL